MRNRKNRKNVWNYLPLLWILICGFTLAGCGEDEGGIQPPTVVVPPERQDTSALVDSGPINFSQFSDTYGQLASPDQAYSWRHYNSHDPSVVDARDFMEDPGSFFYSYGTDVAFGHAIRPGLQIRRSINLVEWEFVGWVFNGLPTAGSSFITTNGGIPNNGLWAPYMLKVGDEYRLYYSLASNVGRLSCIGLAVSDDPRGPFQERGIVVRSVPEGTHTNAIDPSIVIDNGGRHWMYYGSSWDGIYLMELNPETGLALTNGSIGRRIAHRGFTNGIMNGNIEGPEIIYNEEFGMYYLFIAYDWLETKYNVRVGRSMSPEGLFVDIHGQDMNQFQDDNPMLIAPYQFNGHSGWQGVSHPAVFEKDGQTYMAHQGRPGVNPFYMVLHTRQVFWTEDGWPMVSSQRFALEDETPVEESELVGEWESIRFGYRVVPGFANEQTTPDFQVSQPLVIDEGGTVNGNANTSWSYEAPWLTISLNGGAEVRTLFIERGRDWENGVASTILFTGMNQEAVTYWGKKIE
jgi:arabinan endo-1,5-alpha-L-arabinosidase